MLDPDPRILLPGRVATKRHDRDASILLGAIEAVAAASLALRGDGSRLIPLGNRVEAMRQTGEAMSGRFKETSLGGLVVNLPEC